MNPTNINQMLWSNLIASTSANNICMLIDTTMSEHSDSDIVDMLNIIVHIEIPAEKIKPIIDIVESHYIIGSVVDLAPYLSVLYHKEGVEYLSKYYLGLSLEVPDELKEVIEPLLENYSEEAELECAAESISNYDFKREYIYHGQEKEYSIHSFSKTIGKNATVLKTPYGAILFDCGAACGVDETDVITEIEMLEFFMRIDISPDDLLAVIISHAHLDHYGSIATILNLGIDISRIYIEDDTKALIQQVATGIPSLENAISINAFFTPFQRIKITAFPNGHILGSTGYIVTFDELNVIYTGDYCIHSQKTVPGLNIDCLRRNASVAKYGVDCLITETTYGRKSAPIEYENVSKIFLHFVDLLILHGYKVLIPSFAIGRSQEIALLLNETHSVLIDGLAAKISRIYENIAGIKIFSSRTRYNENFEYNKEENFDCNDIIIASSGMLSYDSTSYNYVKTFLGCNRKVAIIKTGYINSESYGNELLNKWKSQDARLFDISLSAHSDFNEIYTLISELEPKHIVCIHGDGLKASLKPEQPKTVFNNSEHLNLKTQYGDEKRNTKSEYIDKIDIKIEKENEMSKSSGVVVIETDASIGGDNKDAERETSSDSVVLPIDSKVIEEICAKPNDLIRSLIEDFIEAYNQTEKTNRNTQRSEKNERPFNAYYELYSYVRLHKEYKEVYNVLFSLEVNKEKIYSYLCSLLRILDGAENEMQEETQQDDPEWGESSVLYVHKGTIGCQRDNHNVVAATAVLLGKNDRQIEMTVNYCRNCKKFFINYISYVAYRNKYGILIGNIVLEDEGRNIFSDVVLAEASPLKLCGYSVNQQDGYSKETRWYIISKIIDRGIMSKSEVIKYLEYFISINGKKRGNQLALSKWKEDLKFTLDYDAQNQERHLIDEIKRY